MKAFVFILSLLTASTAGAEEIEWQEETVIKGREMKDCMVSAANNVVKLNPAYTITAIAMPEFSKAYREKDEFNKPVKVLLYRGHMDFAIGDLTGEQHYSCTFVPDNKGTWHFSWAGVGGRDPGAQ